MDISPESNSSAIAVIFACITALISIISAVAAWKSATAAKTLARSTAVGERRRLVLSVAQIAQEVLSKAASLKRLCDEINVTYDSLATFTGNLGSSRQKLFKGRVDENRAKGAAIISYVQSSLPEEKPIDELSDEEISDLLVKLTMKREELVELSSVLLQEKVELKSQLLIYQEKAANSQ